MSVTVPTIILASQSPRRKQLLEWAEVSFEIIVPATDESYPEGISPEEVSVHIATQKALAVQQLLTARYTAPADFPPILAADTIVVLGNQLIGKPADRSQAIAILESLSGKDHRVITGVSILKGDREICFSDTTEVGFHPLSREQIEYYVDRYRPYDKAGAYAIQEWIGVTGIRSIRGDFYNVMGLPVSRVIRSLQQL